MNISIVEEARAAYRKILELSGDEVAPTIVGLGAPKDGQQKCFVISSPENYEHACGLVLSIHHHLLLVVELANPEGDVIQGRLLGAGGDDLVVWETAVSPGRELGVAREIHL